MLIRVFQHVPTLIAVNNEILIIEYFHKRFFYGIQLYMCVIITSCVFYQCVSN